MNISVNDKEFYLTQEEIENFHKNGYAGPFQAYEAEEMGEIFKKLRPQLVNTENAIYGGADGISGVTNISNYDRHLDVELLAEHICKREIVDRVASIVGKNLLCWRTEFFPKYPGDEGTDWHQAGNFSNVSSSQTPKIEWPENSEHSGAITVWTAFTESTIEKGCLQFIPGTHRTMFYDESKTMSYNAEAINSVKKGSATRGFFGYDYRELQKDPNWRPDESQAVPLIMKPGQFMIFWSTLLHASHPYSLESGPIRLGYSARYVPTEVKVYPYSDTLEEFGASASLDSYGAVLVSGKNEFEHNKLLTHTTTGSAFKPRL